MKLIAVATLAVAALVCAPASSGKDFGPGDLRLCGAKRCVSIKDRPLLRALSTFIYSGPQPRRAPAPLLGAPVLQLRFRNGYIAGDVGGTSLERFRSHGVICGRFQRGSWYRLAPHIPHELRRLAGTLEPLHLHARVPRSC
jgi:hypothetical protein